MSYGLNELFEKTFDNKNQKICGFYIEDAEYYNIMKNSIANNMYEGYIPTYEDVEFHYSLKGLSKEDGIKKILEYRGISKNE